MNTYEAKQDARRQRLEAAAAKAKQEAERLQVTADRMYLVIPLGQPILVGHHSEKRDRRYRARCEATLGKGFEAADRARDLARRADAVGTAGVSSDDPEAIRKLREELASLEELQDRSRRVNALVRKGDRDGLAAMDLSPRAVAALFEPDVCGRIGIPDYMLSNRSANMRRIRQRIEALEAASAEPPREPMSGPGYEIREDVEDNRVCVFFDKKPDESVRTALKANGFRWSPTRGAWVRMRSNAAWYHAAEAIKAMGGTADASQDY